MYIQMGNWLIINHKCNASTTSAVRNEITFTQQVVKQLEVWMNARLSSLVISNVQNQMFAMIVWVIAQKIQTDKC